MKKYSAQNNQWKENKALGFFLNFINNHKGTVNDIPIRTGQPPAIQTV